MKWLSIVIPTFNRASTLPRAVVSCLRQATEETEVIIVDDASTDDSHRVIQECCAKGAVSVRLASNQGVSVARSAGVDAASGEWILFLDSDDELVPGALVALRGLCERVGIEINRLACMCLHDDGRVSPDPWVADSTMTYRGYLEWSEKVGRSDFSNCIRRSSFSVVCFPSGRSYESVYHLDFAKVFQTLCCSEVIARVHSDAPNQLTRSASREVRRRLLVEAEARMRSMADIVERHGDGLLRYAPSRAWMFSRACVTSALMAGYRGIAVRQFFRHIRLYRWPDSTWIAFAVGLFSRRVLAAVIANKMSL